MTRPRLFRLLVIACIAAVSLGSSLLISSEDAADSRAAQVGK